MSTYYDILRIPESADDKEIKAAYRQAALAYHPDHIPKGVSKRMRDDAAQAWLEIQEAFSVLGNPAKRDEYDTLLEEMRQSEEVEKQFEPLTPPPTPPPPKPTPPPTPQQNSPPPTPQPNPSPAAKHRSAWLSFCFQMGRHWRAACLVIAGVLFVASGLQNPDTWGTMLSATASINVLVACFILIKAGPSPEKTRRYLLNAFCLITLAVVGITAGSNSSLPPKATPTAAANVPATAATPDKGKSSSTSDTPFADTLKKYGLETMPQACQNVFLDNLDSCLAKATSEFGRDHAKNRQEAIAIAIAQNSQATIRETTVGDIGWLATLPREYLFACFETDRSRCSTTITHLNYQRKRKILLETSEFQDYFLDDNDRLKPSPGRWHVSCPLHVGNDGHWRGECTYTLFWPEEGKPDSITCRVSTPEEITAVTEGAWISGITGAIDWAPRRDKLNPLCPEDSGKKKDFHLVPKH